MAYYQFKKAGYLIRHGKRLAGRLEITDPDLCAMLNSWADRPTKPYVYKNASSIKKGNRFFSFELRTQRNPDHLDGFIAIKDLVSIRIAWNNTLVSKELNDLFLTVLGKGRCKVLVDIDYIDTGRGVLAIRRPDTMTIYRGQQIGSNEFAKVIKNSGQYKAKLETNK